MNKKTKWDLNKVKRLLEEAFSKNSERKLLSLIKNNSFLLYELYQRKYNISPCFAEIPFGDYRCDFCWLNENSDGPEWVLVEIEKPSLSLFKKNGDPTYYLTHAIEQVKSWKIFFERNPYEAKRIFGPIARFRFVLVGGSKTDWNKPNAIQWRLEAKNNGIEIHSSDVFLRSLQVAKTNYTQLWSFEEYPLVKSKEDLKSFVLKSEYLLNMKQFF